MQFLCLHLLFHLANKPAASLLHRCLGSWRFNLVPHGSCVGGWTASMWERSLEKTQLSTLVLHTGIIRTKRAQSTAARGCKRHNKCWSMPLGRPQGSPPASQRQWRWGEHAPMGCVVLVGAEMRADEAPEEAGSGLSSPSSWQPPACQSNEATGNVGKWWFWLFWDPQRFILSVKT